MLEFMINGLVMVSMVVALYCLKGYVQVKGIKFPWWKWLLSCAWLLGMSLVFAFIGTAIGEGEPGAALRGGGIFLAILALAGVCIFTLCFTQVLTRNKKAIQKATE